MQFEYEQFIKTIQHKADLSWGAAERAARVVLSTLGERLSSGEARDIASQLPGDLGPWLSTDTDAEPFHADEFLRRIAERADVDLDTAERLARAVFAALGRAVSADELEDMAAELPKDFAPLIAEAERQQEIPEEVLPAEEFVRRVADRSALEEQEARHATDAVLETLGERIAAGEVRDLSRQLAPELRSALERGNDRSGGKAQRMSLEEFVLRVAEREGVDFEQAEDRVRAVLVTLREAISPKEFADMSAGLPDEYGVLLSS